MIPASRPMWEVPAVVLVQRACERVSRDTEGGYASPGTGVVSMTYSRAGVQARVRFPLQGIDECRQWTWAELDAGAEGQIVPFDRVARWTKRELAEGA